MSNRLAHLKKAYTKPSSGDALLDAWFSVLISQNHSTHTIKAYEQDLLTLKAFLMRNDAQQSNSEPVSELMVWLCIDLKVLEDFIATRSEQDGLSKNSLQRSISAARGFYAWLEAMGHIAHNPFHSFFVKREARTLPDMVDIDTIARLLNQPKPNGSQQKESQQNKLWLRDKAALELLYGSGLRVSELVGLDIEDMDLTRKQMRVLGKGKKVRILPIGTKALAALNDWLLVRPEFLTHGLQAVFVSQKRSRMSVRSVQRRTIFHAKRAGIPQSVYPHLLRHCFASHMLSDSGNLRAVQELLGHKNIGTTQIYTHLDFVKLTKVYDGAHPRAHTSTSQVSTS